MAQGNSAAHVHKLVAKTAKGIAEDLYETLMQNNELYTAWKLQHKGLGDKQLRVAFVKKNLSRCLEPARTTLTLMLRGTLDESLKETISEALILDAQLVRGRQNGSTIIGRS